MMENLDRMGKVEGVVFSERTFTTNSHKALLLAEAAKEEGPEVFEALNEGLFRAYFTEGRNIGDPRVLREVAEAAAVPSGRIGQAWSDPAYEERLARDHAAAAGNRHHGGPHLHRRRPMDHRGRRPGGDAARGGEKSRDRLGDLDRNSSPVSGI